MLKFYKFCTSKSIVVDPYRLQPFGEKQFITESQIFSKVVQSSKSQQLWKSYQLSKRKQIVDKFVTKILSQKANNYQIISRSIGKCRRDIDYQYQRLQIVYRKLINSADQALKEIVIENNQHTTIKYIKQPLGLVLLFPHFSEPIFDTLIKLIPSLVAGNGVLIKASPFCPFVGEYLQSTFNELSGIPQLISDTFINGTQTENLFQFRQIRQITFSGSHSSGKHIFQLVAKERFIDVNLFYGGKDAAYIDQTANIDQIVQQIVRAAFYNCGQSFDSLKRLYIHKDKVQQTVGKLVQKVSQFKLGDPLDPSTTMGPICIQQDLLNIQSLINEAVSEGAQCLIGGTIITDGQTKGNFVQPTILNRCQSNMSILQTETVAPILCISTVENDEQFVNELNSNRFGVGARIFTKDVNKYQSSVKKMNVGRISFNKSDYISQNLPIQGWKQSGKGKMLSPLSYQEIIKHKSIYIVK